MFHAVFHGALAIAVLKTTSERTTGKPESSAEGREARESDRWHPSEQDKAGDKPPAAQHGIRIASVRLLATNCHSAFAETEF